MKNIFNDDISVLMSLLMCIVAVVGAIASALFSGFAGVEQSFVPMIPALIGCYAIYKRIYLIAFVAGLGTVLLLNYINGAW